MTPDVMAADEIPHEIVAAHPKNFPPYYTMDDKGRSQGFAIEVFDRVAKQAGLKVTYMPLDTWQDVEDAILSKKADVIPNSGISEQRATYRPFTSPMDMFRVSFFTLSTNQRILSEDDISGLSVGTTVTNIAEKKLKERSDIELKVFPNIDVALDALLNQNIEVLVFPEYVINRLAAEQGVSDQIRRFGNPFMEVRRAISVRSDLPELRKHLDDALKVYIQTSEFDEIYRKWFVSTEPNTPTLLSYWWVGYGVFAVLALGVVGRYALWRKQKPAAHFSSSATLLAQQARRRGLGLVLILVLTAGTVAAVVLVVLYQTALKEFESRLVDYVETQVHLIDATARFNIVHNPDYPGGAAEATFAQILDGLRPISGPVELVLAKQTGGSIEFLFRQKAAKPDERLILPFNSQLAAPMRNALKGRTGTIVGPDYRNKEVLAAYAHVNALDIGVVGKIETSRIRAPYIQAALMAGGIGLIVIGVGVLTFVLFNEPTIRRLTNSETRFRDLAEASPSGIFEASPNGECTYVNDRLCKMTGLEKEDFLGLGWLDNIKKHGRARAVSKWQKAIRNQWAWSDRLDFIKKDGTELPVLGNSVPRFNDKGELSGYIGTLTDVSDLNEAIKEMERSQKAAEDANKAKSEFLSIVSHELRTPLTSIKGSLGLLSGHLLKDQPNSVRKMLVIASQNADRLNMLVNDILDMEKFMSGNASLHMEILDLHDLVASTIEQNQGFAKEYDVEFELVSENQGFKVRGDVFKLGQVIGNFLSNAAKFSDGSDRVEISISKYNQKNRVAVTDYGRGIPEEFTDRIFEQFTQVEMNDERSRSGTGLGLSICKAIIEQHDGHIGFVSKLGYGTTFFFDLDSVD